MPGYSYTKQIRAVIIIEVIIVLFCSAIALVFWNSVCDGPIEVCLKDMQGMGQGYFLLLSVIRPFIFTPVSVFAYIAGDPFGPLWGAVLTALGATFSAAVVYGIAKPIGKKLVNPWLSSNLPQTLKFIRSQDWKITVACRLIPFFPFDLLSLGFGLVDFRFKYVMAATFFATLPEAYMFAAFADPDTSLLNSTISALTIICVFLLIPAFIIEYASRKKGTSLWVRLKAMWAELVGEVILNNGIVKRHTISGNKTPVLLLYGFFSSRRALTVIERQLNRKGYEVLSFNLGGVLGVFFTKGIIETAEFIDYKLKRQFKRHNFNKVHIIGHSKGGLVALWWVLKLGGDRYCKKIITMGTPFQGTRLTWLALVTPLGFMWKDVWQMRPSSDFLATLKESQIPEGVEIHCLYSEKDGVAKGNSGLFEPGIEKDRDKIFPVPMHHVTHFEFLYRRSVGDTLAAILGPAVDLSKDQSENSTANKTKKKSDSENSDDNKDNFDRRSTR